MQESGCRHGASALVRSRGQDFIEGKAAPCAHAVGNWLPSGDGARFPDSTLAVWAHSLARQRREWTSRVGLRRCNAVNSLWHTARGASQACRLRASWSIPIPTCLRGESGRREPLSFRHTRSGGRKSRYWTRPSCRTLNMSGQRCFCVAPHGQMWRCSRLILRVVTCVAGLRTQMGSCCFAGRSAPYVDAAKLAFDSPPDGALASVRHGRGSWRAV